MVQVGTETAGSSSAASQLPQNFGVIDEDMVGDAKRGFVSSVLSLDWFFQHQEEELTIEGTEPLPEEPRLPPLGARAKKSGLSRQDRCNLALLDSSNGFGAPTPTPLEPTDLREQVDNSRGKELEYTTLNVDSCVVVDTLLESRRFVGTMLDAVVEATTASVTSSFRMLCSANYSECFATTGDIDASPADSSAHTKFRRCIEVLTPAS